MIHRLPLETKEQRSLGGRSRCPRCGVGIRWADNVPILGWLLLRGRSRCCSQPISPRYPAVELLTAVLFWWLLVSSPLLAAPSLEPFSAPLTFAADGTVSWSGEAAAAFVMRATFLSLLVACTFIDFDHFILPDALTKPGMVIGVVAGIWPGLAGAISSDPGVALPVRTALASIVGLLVGGGVTWAIRAVGSKMLRQEAMGLGDVKFLAMVGAFLGYSGVLLTLFLGCIFGAAVGVATLLRGGLSAKLPFGPYLALGAVVAMFWAQPILDFLFETWPEWQRSTPRAQWLILVVALFSLVLLFALVRRSRRSG
ncbi:MAG: prepilin peptidase [Planctomycetes bacterium]|nr:prepilin peptidase [Planctomycetota bacterium]